MCSRSCLLSTHGRQWPPFSYQKDTKKSEKTQLLAVTFLKKPPKPPDLSHPNSPVETSKAQGLPAWLRPSDAVRDAHRRKWTLGDWRPGAGWEMFEGDVWVFFSNGFIVWDLCLVFPVGLQFWKLFLVCCVRLRWFF